MNKYLSSMKKNYIYGILIILLIASIILGYFLYKEKKEYAITTQNQYNFALYELIDYVQDLENYLANQNPLTKCGGINILDSKFLHLEEGKMSTACGMTMEYLQELLSSL